MTVEIHYLTFYCIMIVYYKFDLYSLLDCICVLIIKIVVVMVLIIMVPS